MLVLFPCVRVPNTVGRTWRLRPPSIPALPSSCPVLPPHAPNESIASGGETYHSLAPHQDLMTPGWCWCKPLQLAVEVPHGTFAIPVLKGLTASAGPHRIRSSDS